MMGGVIVPGGLYRHYKGKLYRAISTARHSETLEEYVYYETLYDTEYGRLWIRPASMWNETIIHEGKAVPRFELVKEDQ
jgi:hypothetical protein